MVDLLLRSVRIAGDPPCDLLVRGGRVARIGHRLRADGAESVSANGRHLLPGFWDEHVHMTQWALSSGRIDLGHEGSAADVVARVKKALKNGPPAGGRPVVGVGFRDAVWPDAPTRAALDAVAGEVPVILRSHDLHCAWLNGAGARWCGIDVDESGLLREEPAFSAHAKVDDLPEPLLDELVHRAAKAAASRGVVGVVDFEMAWNVESWTRRVAAGFDAVAVEAAVYVQHLHQVGELGLRTGDALPGTDGDVVRLGPLKALADGALNTRTAYCADPYPDGSTGIPTMSLDEIGAVLRQARRMRLTPAIHAIGDAAVTEVLDAFEAAKVRGRIEHAQLVATADLRRFRALDVTASVQPGHLLDDREVAERHWPGRTNRAFPFASLLESGATLAFGSDAPVAALDPWLALRAAVRRAQPGKRGWHAEQRIAFEQALAASTRGRTRVTVGDRADLVLTDDPPDSLPSRPVAATIRAGRFTHRTF